METSGVWDRFRAVFIAAFVFAPVGASAETIRCSHEFPPQHYATGLIERWAVEVERLTKGRIEIELIGGAALFRPQDNILAVAKGHIECAFSLNVEWSRKLPPMTVMLAPFLTASPNIPRRWANSEAAQFLEHGMREKGVQPVAWLFLTNQLVITSKGRHILRPEDFAGLSMRGRSPALGYALRQLGAKTVPMDSSQLYEAMRVRVIDAAVTDATLALTLRLYDHHDHMVVLPLGSVYANAYVTPQWYDLLDDDLKEAFRQAGETAMQASVSASMAAVAAAQAMLRDRGVNVHVASAEEIEALRAVLQPAFLEMFLDEAGEDGREVIDLIRKLE